MSGNMVIGFNPLQIGELLISPMATTNEFVYLCFNPLQIGELLIRPGVVSPADSVGKFQSPSDRGTAY